MTTSTRTRAQSPARAAGGGRRRGAQGHPRAPYVLIAPAVALLTCFLLVPMIYTVWLSLRAKQVSGGGILGRRVESFVGLQNYVATLTDQEFWRAMGRMAAYGLIVVPIMFCLALLFALLLDSPRTRLRSASRVVIFLPYAVPGVIASLLWGFIYMPRVSPIHRAADWLGLPAPDFLSSSTVLFSVSNIAVWGGTGFNMVILYTALRAIPTELYDSARIDGCGEVKIARHIKIPLLTPALIMTTIFALIAMIQVYNEPQALSSLTTAISSTWVPMMKVYSDAFVVNNLYRAAATSVILALVTLGISLGVLSLASRRSGEGSRR